MAWRSLSIVAFYVAVCDSRRILTSSTVSTSDPEWCITSVDPANCNAMQKRMCKELCSGKVKVAEETEAASAQKDKIAMDIVNEDMSPTALIKVRRSALYEHAWPTTCEGKNQFDEFIVGLSTDRFLCNPDNGAVHEINSPGYRVADRMHSCCDKKCQSQKACDHVTYTFAEAARAALSTAALKADHVVTEHGRKVQINVEQTSEEVFAATGVHASVEVRMPDSDLEFEPRLHKLTVKGETFLTDLAGALGPLISMQVSAYETLSKVVICTHAETTATFEGLQGGPYELLPKNRANRVREVLSEVVPEDKASLGDGIAHYSEEVEGYISGRRAFIIYKLYDPSFPAPQCERDDLHMFVSKYADAA